MNPEQALSQAFIEAHPDDAAAILEQLPAEETAALMAEEPPSRIGKVLGRMAPSYAAQCLASLAPEQAGAIVTALPLDSAARLLRRVGLQVQDELLTRLPVDHGAPLRRLLRYPEGSAGALMDPQVAALPGDVTVEEATRRMRESPHDIIYYLYVVDRDGRLIGVLNLRELMLASRHERLASVMCSHVERLSASAGRAAIVAHPAWREFHALPVIDDAGVFLGVVRYEVLRKLEVVEPRARPARPPDILAGFLTFGEAYWVGLFRLLGGLVAAVSRRPTARNAGWEKR